MIPPKIFLPFYTKRTGPPVLRHQVMGVGRHRFLRLVACNRRDKRDGKHMEVLGSYVIQKKDLSRELRLRFTRVKFWLGAGAQIGMQPSRLLAKAGLIPIPPPTFGRRTEGHLEYIKTLKTQWDAIGREELQSFDRLPPRERAVVWRKGDEEGTNKRRRVWRVTATP